MSQTPIVVLSIWDMDADDVSGRGVCLSPIVLLWPSRYKGNERLYGANFGAENRNIMIEGDTKSR